MSPVRWGRQPVGEHGHRHRASGGRATDPRIATCRAVLDGASEAQLAVLGPAVVDPDAVPGLVDDDLPFDDSEEAQAEWEQTFASG